MEEITTKISKIQNDLHSSRDQLHVLETSARKTISSDLDGIRDSLKNGDSRAEHIATQLRLFLSQIEYVGDSTSINMTSQVVWLCASLEVIVSDLDSAKVIAHRSIECAKQFSYKVMDLGEEVNSSSNKLSEHYNEVAKLAKEAESSLRSSESMLAYTQSQMKGKEQEIRGKTAEAALKRQRKTQLEAELGNIRQQMARAEQERRERKKQALTGIGIGVLGILAAPFTLGGSLVATVGAGGVVGYKAVRMDEFQADINSNQQSINSLNTEISKNTQGVATLEREKTNLQKLVNQYASEVTTRRAQHRIYQNKIKQADLVKGEITILKSHADSTKKNVAQALPELHKIKQSLEQCSTLVKERSLEVSTSSTYLERFTANIPVVGRMKRAQDFQKQKLILKEASDVLDKVHAEVPRLLPCAGEVKFLDFKSWNSGSVSVVDVGNPIPDVCYYGNN